MKQRFFGFYLVLFFCNLNAQAQSSVGFTINKSGFCLEETVLLQDTTSNSSRRNWDFCPADIASSPQITTNIGAAVSSTSGIKIVKDGDYFFGFSVSTGGNKIYRYEFGTSLQNFPVITDMGNLGLLASPEGIDIIKVENEWVGFVGHSLNGGGFITRLVWASLNEIPTAESIGNLGVPSRIRDVRIVKQDDNYIGVFPYFNGSSLIRVDFGATPKNSVSPENIYNSGTLTDVSLPIAIDVLNMEGEWKVILGSITTKTIAVFNLGNNLLSTPNHIRSGTFTEFQNLSKMTILEELGGYFAYLSTTGPSRLVNLKSLSSSDIFEEVITTALPAFYGVDAIKDSSAYYIFGASSRLNRIKFQSNCSASNQYSEDISTDVSYDQPGIYPITLSIYDVEGNVASLTKEVTITSDEAPSGELLLHPAYCIAKAITPVFTTDDSIISYNWDFGDGTTSTEETPSHEYTSAGTYTIALSVESSEGCTNVFTKEVMLFDEPEPAFSTTKDEYCAFEPIVFTNGTPGDFGENISWSWDFNGEGSSIDQNPEYIFQSAGTKTITLQADVFGCIGTVEKQITIVNGPEPSFTYDSDCLNENILFTNTSTGENITSYAWDFGDGRTSTEENPSIAYATAGEYEVQLTVTSSSGCETSTGTVITVYDQIIASIEHSDAVENLPFAVGASLVDGLNQAVTYHWEMEGENQSSDTAQFIFPAGNYDINLSVTTEKGCVFDATSLVVVKVSEYATPGFVVAEEACLEENIELHNTSINANRYEWDFCPDDLTTSPKIASDLGGSFTSSNGFAMAKAGNDHYGFAITASSLFRLDFGNTLQNTPQVTALGNLGIINNAEDIAIVKEGDKWIGFTGFGSTSNGGNVFKLVWDDLSAIPTIENIGNFGVAGRIRGLDILKDGEHNLLVLAGSDNKLIRADFGDSFLNTLAEGDIHISNALESVPNVIDISLIKKGQEWQVVVGTASSKTLLVFSLAAGLLAEPVLVNSGEFASFANITKLKVIRDNGNYYAAVSTTNSIVRLVNLKDLNAGDTFEEVALTDMPVAYGIDVVKEDGSYYVLGTRTKLQRVLFKKDCQVSQETSTEENPIVFYGISGTYDVELTAYSGTTSSSVINQVTVTSNEAPLGDIVLNSAYCIAVGGINPVFSTEESITSYSWDFGDGTTSTEETPSHEYTSAGTYTIALSVESSEGCTNVFTKDVMLFDEHEPAFSTTKEEYCAFEPIVFTNGTPGDFGENISWSWDFNGEGSSIDQNPEYIFQSAGTKTITLQADVLGCIETIAKQITIVSGPEPSFTYDSDCLNENILFTNTSTGENITSYAWDFGDGRTSTEEHPSIAYATAGEHEVQLTVASSSGCETSTGIVITIYDQIIAYIEHTDAVENLPFAVGASLVDGLNQAVTYQWEMEGENQSSDTAHYVFPAGIYDINLSVTTEKGCVFNETGLVEVKVSEYATPSFVVAEEACLEENIELQNTSINADRYEWDFCPDDLTTSPKIASDLGGSFTSSNGFAMAKSGNDHYGFAISASSLFRLYFGNSLQNIPTVTDLGNLGILDNAEDIAIVKEGDKWIGFIGFGATSNGGNVFKLVWDDLSIIPTIENIGNFGVVGRIRGLDIVQEGENNILVLAGSDNKLIRADFGDSFLNTLAEGHIHISNALESVPNVIDISLIKKGQEWQVVVGTASTKTLLIFSLADGLLAEPVLVNSGEFASFANIAKLKVIRDNGNYYAAVSTTNSIVRLVDLKDLNPGDTFEEIALTDMPVAYGIDVVKEDGGYYVLGTRTKLQQVLFKKDCQVSQETSTEENPVLSYNWDGNYNIVLTAFHKSGKISEMIKAITVNPFNAPEVDISYDNVCLLSEISFTSVSNKPITSHTWSFGDTNTTSGDTVHHQYSAPGTYNIRLDVSDGTCTNFVTDSITIYADAPKPAFDIQTLAYCTSNEIQFTNLTNSSGIPDSLVTYLWDFNAEMSSSAKIDTTIIFNDAGDKNISLTASIPGCFNDTTAIITINTGTDVAFEFENECAEETVNFTNLTEGTVTSYLWDFGNNSSSDMEHTTAVFDEPGKYAVTLQAINELNCLTQKTDTITIHALPTTNFDNELSCEGSVTTFYDKTSVQDANIVSWNWVIDEEVFSTPGPAYTFSEKGNYAVKLLTASEYGCKDSIEQVITVNTSPTADYSYEKLCINEPVEFTDASTMEEGSIEDRYWIINGDGYSTEGVDYNFNEPGVYEVQLIVTADNLCRSSVSKTITIQPAPSVDLEHNTPCEGKPLDIFASIESPDAVSTIDWMVNFQNYGPGDNISFIPPAAGSNAIRLDLEITTEGGCHFYESKNFTVNETPNAEFEVSTAYGGSPLKVSVTDLSSGADEVSWFYNDESIQVSEPVMLTELGIGRMLQLATSAEGCTDTASLAIEVVPAILDLELNKIRYINDGGEISFIVDIINNGTAQVEDMEILFDINNEASFKEKVNEFMNSGDKISQLLSSTLENPPRFVCLTLSSIGNMPETNLDNNRGCINFRNESFMIPPFPNPVTDKLNVQFIPDKNVDVRIELINSFGQILIDKTVQGKRSELYTYQIDVLPFNKGYYIIKITAGEKYETFPVMINR